MENVQRDEEEWIAAEAKAAEEVRLAEEVRVVEEEWKRREAEEERQAAISLAKYQRKEAEKAEVQRIKAEKAAFKKQEDTDVVLHKAKEQREAKAKVKKEVAVMSESEKAEGSRKQGQEDEEAEISVTVRSFLMEHGVKWMVKEGVVCDSCEKKKKKCFWKMEAGWGKACLACHDLKKGCISGGGEEEEEAGPLKKSRVEQKREGKAKAKVRTPFSEVTESVGVNVLWYILKELTELCVKVHNLHVFSQHSITLLDLSWRTLRQTNAHISEFLDHFVPLKNDREGSRAENEEASREQVENGEMHDVEIEENGADMALMRLCSKLVS